MSIGLVQLSQVLGQNSLLALRSMFFHSQQAQALAGFMTAIGVLSVLTARAERAALHDLATPAWLAEAAKPERVCAALVRHVREFASGMLTLRDCKVKRLRLRDGTAYWTGIYVFTVEGLPSAGPEVVRVLGAVIPPGFPAPDRVETGALFGNGAWRCYLPELRLELRTQPPETKLAVLPRLTDSEAAREILEQSICACAPAYCGLRIKACTPEVVRYKPGSRCTILYHVEYPDSLEAGRHWPEIVVAKTYSDERGRSTYHAMRALWNSPLARSGSVAIAEPLAFIPQLRVLVQGPVREEHTLREFLRMALQQGTPEAVAELRSYIRKAALGLAELHRCGVTHGKTFTWEDELAEIRKTNARLAVYLPRNAEVTTALLAPLERLAAQHPADPPGPSHGSFRPSQVLLHEEGIGFIDFDRFCQAEPALDLARFMTGLKHSGLNNVKTGQARSARVCQLEEICGVFLDAYTSVMPVSWPRVALWEALDLVTLLQDTWTHVKPERFDETVLLLERHLIKL